MEPLIALAERRGDAEPVWRRAAVLCRTLNIAPWIALGVAERRLTLADAAVLDRAARCKQLQEAVLDKQMTLDELRTAMPYAPYLLAAELVEPLGAAGGRLPELVEIARALLSREPQPSEDGTRRPIRQRPLADYVAAAGRIRALQRTERCDLKLAIECETGLIGLDLLRQHTRRVRPGAAVWRPPAAASGEGAARPFRPPEGHARAP
jgi:hypothetical protein